MARTVNAAFDYFISDVVNLDKAKTTTARASRDWLLQQISTFQNTVGFPKLSQQDNIHFGSFARRTKIRPLDDIDLMICLDGTNTQWVEYNNVVSIRVNPNGSSQLNNLCKPNTNVISSIKLINTFVNKLNSISQYQHAQIKRNQEAVTLSLKSYEWTFDIVPCFITTVDNGISYYLIPDGQGNWKKTDPRIDRDKAKNINQKHNGYVLNVIRIIKYWNKRPTMPTMSSYLLETMILNYYSSISRNISQYIDVEIPYVLEYIKDSIYNNIADPKNIQGNINHLDFFQKQRIANRASSDWQKALEARQLEDNSDQANSIKKWGEIFGNQFPTYG
jgi:hypothetical protein